VEYTNSVPKGRLAVLNKEMENFKLALLGVSEVRWNGAEV
jgi:hypothetical protein